MKTKSSKLSLAKMQKPKPKRGSKVEVPYRSSLASTSRQSQTTPSAWKPVVQPPEAYPRFAFRFVLLNDKGKKRVIAAAAYTTALAEKQARSFCILKGWTFVKVRKVSRLNWSGPGKGAPWKERAVQEYQQAKGA